MQETKTFQALVPSERFPEVRANPGAESAVWWRSLDGLTCRGYLSAASSPGPDWEEILSLAELAGRSAGETEDFHYVVETDVAAEFEDDLNAWYREEHLPGLAAVPGTIRARRYVRTSGAPKYIAAYELVSPEAMTREEWLAVRNTAWSDRVRPRFVNPRRTLYRRV